MKYGIFAASQQTQKQPAEELRGAVTTPGGIGAAGSSGWQKDRESGHGEGINLASRIHHDFIRRRNPEVLTLFKWSTLKSLLYVFKPVLSVRAEQVHVSHSGSCLSHALQCSQKNCCGGAEPRALGPMGTVWRITIVPCTGHTSQQDTAGQLLVIRPTAIVHRNIHASLYFEIGLMRSKTQGGTRPVNHDWQDL